MLRIIITQEDEMDIRHNEIEQKFVVQVGDEECALKYKELSAKLWNFESTSVPKEAERGMLNQMIEYAFNFVREHNIKILASCEDVQNFLVQHKDLKTVVYHPY
jgi:predicted GNAT family acetyltransferase